MSVAELEADVVVVGAGLAGLTATAELADAGRRVVVLDQEPEASLGGQAFWSLGGLFLVDSHEQRRVGILPAPSSMWLDATGKRLPVPLFPGFDTLATLRHIGTTGHDHTWSILTRRIIEREFALFGSEQNPDLTQKNIREVIRQRVLPGVPDPIQRFMDRGADFVVRRDLRDLVAGMNALTDEPLLDFADVEREVVARDREIKNPFTKDLQVAAIRDARRYIPDRLSRVAAPHRLLDPKAGPLIAVRLNILTRKTLGGLQTDLDGQVLTPSGQPFAGLYAAGEVAGFGGGGMHGYNSLEGTFVGGCMFSGRTAGRALARRLA